MPGWTLEAAPIFNHAQLPASRDRDRMSVETPASPQWYVVQCGPRQDAGAEEGLGDQHIPYCRMVGTPQVLRQKTPPPVEESLFSVLNAVASAKASIPFASRRGVLRLLSPFLSCALLPLPKDLSEVWTYVLGGGELNF